MCIYNIEIVGNKRILRIDCSGCKNDASMSNANCMFNVMGIVKEHDPSNMIFAKDIYNLILSDEQVDIIREFVSKTSKEAWSDPISYYRAQPDKTLSSTRMIKAASRYKELNPAEIYHKLFQPQLQPHFISSIINDKIRGRIIGRYNVGYDKVEILAGNFCKYYVLKPFELSLDVEEIKLLSEVFRRIGAEGETAVASHDASRKVYSMAKDIVEDAKPDRKDAIIKTIVRYTTGYGILEPLLSDPNLQDIYVDSPGTGPVYVYHAKFEECSTNLSLSSADLKRLSTRFRALSGRPFDQAFPVLHTEIPGFNIRVCAICEPLTFNGIGMAFRKHKSRPWTLPGFIRNDMLNADAAGLLSFLVDAQVSILVTGPRGSGKTSLLGALMSEAHPEFRFIVMEDTAELPVSQMRSLGFRIEHLKTRISGDYEMNVEDALRTALRLGESVLVVGEVRGEEARSLFEAMRIGAAGNVVLGTIHGSSSYDTWDRIVNDLKVPSTSFKATDIIVSCFAKRMRESIQRYRRVFCIDEVGKHWEDEPDFITLMQYNSSRDGLLFKDIKKSETLKRVAIMRGMTMQSIMQNIKLRAKIRQMMADADLADISHVMLANREFTNIAGKGYSKVLPYFRVWVKKLSH